MVLHAAKAWWLVAEVVPSRSVQPRHTKVSPFSKTDTTASLSISVAIKVDVIPGLVTIVTRPLLPPLVNDASLRMRPVESMSVVTADDDDDTRANKRLLHVISSSCCSSRRRQQDDRTDILECNMARRVLQLVQSMPTKIPLFSLPPGTKANRAVVDIQSPNE
jgi:hypothetical protein